MPEAGRRPSASEDEFSEDESPDIVDNLWNWGHHGELWLSEDDGDYTERYGHPDHRTRKPMPNDAPLYCACGWPVPVNWSWKWCEFGGPTQWRTTEPEAEQVLDDDPLLYRCAPWLWTFCGCNGCTLLARPVGRPPEMCTKCARDARNARRRARYSLVTAIPSPEFSSL